MRVHIAQNRMTLEQADLLEYYLLDKPFITDVKVNDRTGNAIIVYTPGAECRQLVIQALQVFSYEDERAASLVPENTGRALSRHYEEKLVLTVLGHGFRTLFFPGFLRRIWIACNSLRFIAKGLHSLSRSFCGSARSWRNGPTASRSMIWRAPCR